MSYVISDELRDTLLIILQLLRENSGKNYHKYSEKYSDELLLADGKSIKLPFLKQIIDDLRGAEKVIETNEYDSRVEEMILIAREMGLL